MEGQRRTPPVGEMSVGVGSLRASSDSCTNASDQERLARFQREAEVLASLNHPNIAAIYGLEEADSTKALVMELVEGPTLADRIAQGAIPVDEALPIAKQIAEALEAAHEQGIIHRDLKPANIKLRPDGVVKVLDFGLAKALEPTGAMSPGMSQAPTITTPAMTQAGMILGTSAYMSPERAKGRAVDKRSDVWAFGAVLYEMLTGRRAFDAEDVSETLAAVLRAEVDWARLPEGLSPVLRTYIRRCLQKDPKQRVADIQDVRLALEGAFETGESQTVEPVEALPAVVALVVGGLVVGVTAWSLWPSAEPPLVTRFDYVLPEGQQFRDTGRPVMALSADGRHFVYNTSQGLFLRAMGTLEPQLIPGTGADLSSPFFSPDGQSVAYWDPAATQLKRIELTGGAPVVIAQVPTGLFGASWGTDETILFGQFEGILRVSATGGTPELVIPAEEGEQMDSPHLLPDGESVLFSVTTSTGPTRWDEAQIVVQSLATGERTVVLQGGSDARYVPTGHLVYALESGLFAVAFDVDRLEVQGGPVSVAEGVMRTVGPIVGTGTANYGVSDLGTFVYVSGGATLLTRSLVWVARDGREEPVAAAPADYQEFTLSPDGMRVAVHVLGNPDAVWIYDLVRDTTTRLTFESDEVGAAFPTWTPDGTRVAFGPPLSWKRADGTWAVERLDDTARLVPQAFSPDGTTLVFQDDVSAGEGDVGVLTLEGDRTATLVIDGEFSERTAALSPDGRWVAYRSNETGRNEVYVRPFPDVDSGRWQISTAGGGWPVWNPAGNELFYRTPTAVMARAFETEPTFTPGALTQVFERPRVGGGANRRMAVSPDGQRFLLLANAPENADGDAAQPQIIVVQNWFEELRRRVPTN